MSPLNTKLSLFATSLALALPVAAQAQTLPYGDPGGSGEDAAVAGDDAGGSAGSSSRQGRQVEVHPYLEAGLAALFELSPGSDVVTYSVVAVGVDTAINGRNNMGALSLRYERRFGLSDNTSDSDTVSGVARISSAIVPGALQFEAGALAARTSVENSGATVNSPFPDASSS